jgi:hypothetical protein
MAACCISIILLSFVLSTTVALRDRLGEFYSQIKFIPYESFLKSHSTSVSGSNSVEKVSYGTGDSAIQIEYCQDRTKLLPDCKVCIPGMTSSIKGAICDQFVPDSTAIRKEIKGLTLERYGSNMVANRPFGLYPYLEGSDFVERQIKFGSMLSQNKMKRILDIGAYYNPINLFLEYSTNCPESVVIIEPILDPLSVKIPCLNDRSISTHVIFMPITFKQYLQYSHMLPVPDGVVCIGCDSHYGPNRRLLETSFHRPFTLYLEYPSEYVHNAPFRKMNGDGLGEKLEFIHKFQPDTNETQYTKRVMKVIGYT